ncbi:mucin-2 [Eutrema salsugineum]|uniref:mucin-2 n=1 Tax=Eutrema salsugineum TaxID=72664 RepID=UPI000CED0383|nr:mucin-2 [Eutrema salsugineum]
MDKSEPFVYDEVYDKTPKQSPQGNQTWPMDKIRKSRFQPKMSSLLSPVTPKRNYTISNAKSLLMQCLRDSKSDPLPRRRFPVSCSDEGILMDGVLVTSATSGKKVSSSLGCSGGSSIFQKQHKKYEFSSPKSQTGTNLQETTGFQESSAEKEKMLTISPCTPKAANSSKLQASAEPFTPTPRSPPRQASPFPPQQLPYDHYNPLCPWDHPLHLQACSYLHRPRPPFYVYQRPLLLPVLPHGSKIYQLDCATNFPSLTGDPTTTRMSLLPTTPPSSHPNTNTSEPPVHTPLSTPPTANLSTSSTSSTTTHGSSPTVDGLDTVTEKLDFSDELETMTREPDLSSPPSDGLDTVTQIPDSSSPSDGLDAATHNPDLSSPSDELQTVAQNLDLSPSVGHETVTTKTDWSPSDDKLPTFTQEENDFTKSQGRVLPDSAFQLYKFRGSRMSCFKDICTEVEEEDQ